MVKQFMLGQTANESDWLTGAEIFGPAVNGVAVRSMAAPGTATTIPSSAKTRSRRSGSSPPRQRAAVQQVARENETGDTNAGYGLGSSFETVRELCPECTVLEGFILPGCIAAENAVLWMITLGLSPFAFGATVVGRMRGVVRSSCAPCVLRAEEWRSSRWQW